jgi:hypothetical protein
MLELLFGFLGGRLSRGGQRILQVTLLIIILGLMFYFLNYLRLNYFGAMSNAVNAVE